MFPARLTNARAQFARMRQVTSMAIAFAITASGTSSLTSTAQPNGRPYWALARGMVVYPNIVRLFGSNAILRE